MASKSARANRNRVARGMGWGPDKNNLTDFWMSGQKSKAIEELKAAREAGSKEGVLAARLQLSLLYEVPRPFKFAPRSLS